MTSLLNHICYICMKRENNLKRLFLNNCENEEYSKLISSVPEMGFKELEEHGMICAECCTKLDEAHRFREQCLRSKQLILDYISKQRSTTETSGGLNVCVQDYKNLLKIPITDIKYFEHNRNTDELFSMSNIVTSDAFIEDHDGNSLSVKTETLETENQSGSSDTNEAVGEVEVDHVSPSDIGAIIKNKIVIKTESEDTSGYDLKTETRYPVHRESECSGPSGSNYVVATDDVLDNKTNIDSIPMEEIYIKCEPEDISNNEIDELETTNDEDTEITQSPGRKHTKTDTGLHFTREEQTSRNQLECEQTGKTFSNKSKLISQKIVHTGERLFKCNLCDRMFSQKGDFITHMRIHTDKKPFSCHHCDKTFSHRRNLSTHMRTHTGEKPFSCDHCDKMFSQSSNLITHMRIHTGEKPFSCEHCDKMFSQKGDLITHKRTHTGEKPFSCEHCDKMFSQRGDLTVHKRTHTGEKPFVCDHCGKTFSRRGHLIEHKRIHMGEKPFNCDHCDKMFSQRGQLIMHKRTHTGEKPFRCEHCGKSFSRGTNLVRHKRIHTEINHLNESV